MAVDTKHPDHAKWAPDWLLIKTLQEGQRALVLAGEMFLPKLTGQSEKEYTAYIKRGNLFNATARTMTGLVGAIIRKKATVKVPSTIDLEDLTISSQTIDEVIRVITENIMSNGFYGVLVDMPPKEQGMDRVSPYMAPYSALDILNWRTQKIGSDEKLVMVTLLESEQVVSPADPFSFEEKQIIRVCFIDPVDGNYKQEKYRKDERKGSKEQWVKEEETIIPVKQGIPLKEIPFVFISANGCYPVPSKPPMLDLANLNIKHWQLSTDYYHGLHFCAMPTPWAAGFKTGQNLYIGATKAWISDEVNAKCGYLEFTGQGIAAIEKGLDKIERQMAVAGARLLEEQKVGVEAAETVRMRSSGDVATMSSIVGAVEEGTKKALTFMSEWSAADSGKVEVTMNRQFVSQQLSPQQITALLQSVQAGQISQDTFLYNLQVGEVLPPDRTIEDEKKMIEAERPAEDFEEGNVTGIGRFQDRGKE